MKIWLVSIFENTPIDDNQNTRYNSLAREASNRNHDVTFWSSTFRHNIKQQRFDEFKEVTTPDNIKVNFIPAKKYTKNISIKRMFSHFQLAKSMINSMNQQQEKPDVIVIAFPPISIAYEVVKWAKNLKIPVLIDVIDPWPEAFIEHQKGIKKELLKYLIYPLRQKTAYIFKNANAVIAISNQYINWAKSYNKRLTNNAVYYPAVHLAEMQSQLTSAALTTTKKENEFRVIYAGSLGLSYDIQTILKAAAIIEKQFSTSIQFVIAGDGPQKEIIKNYENQHNNLVYLGRLSKEQLMKEYFLADIGLTQHIKGATQSVTYKLFDLLACGLPIMNSLESEMKNIILDNQVGFFNVPGDENELAMNIKKCFEDTEKLKEMKERAKTLTETKGDAKVVYAKALNFIESFKKF